MTTYSSGWYPRSDSCSLVSFGLTKYSTLRFGCVWMCFESSDGITKGSWNIKWYPSTAIFGLTSFRTKVKNACWRLGCWNDAENPKSSDVGDLRRPSTLPDGWPDPFSRVAFVKLKSLEILMKNLSFQFKELLVLLTFRNWKLQKVSEYWKWSRIQSDAKLARNQLHKLTSNSLLIVQGTLPQTCHRNAKC